MANQATLSRTGLVGGVAGALAVAASALAAVAAAISSLDGDLDLVPFFVLLTFAGGLIAMLLQPPIRPARRSVARVLDAATRARADIRGLPATACHMAAAFGGAVLVTVAAFGSPSRLDRSPD